MQKLQFISPKTYIQLKNESKNINSINQFKSLISLNVKSFYFSDESRYFKFSAEIPLSQIFLKSTLNTSIFINNSLSFITYTIRIAAHAAPLVLVSIYDGAPLSKDYWDYEDFLRASMSWDYSIIREWEENFYEEYNQNYFDYFSDASSFNQDFRYFCRNSVPYFGYKFTYYVGNFLSTLLIIPIVFASIAIKIIVSFPVAILVTLYYSVEKNIYGDNIEADRLLRNGILNNNIDHVLKAISNKADLNKKNADGHTLLYLAAQLGYNKFIDVLIDHGAEFISHLDVSSKNYLPLLDINKLLFKIFDRDKVQQSETKVLKELSQLLLINNECLNFKDSQNNSLIHLAVHFNCSLRVVKFLVEHGINIHAKDNSVNTPLGYAILKKNRTLVHYLLKNKANSNDKIDFEEYHMLEDEKNDEFSLYFTPLHLAVLHVINAKSAQEKKEMSMILEDLLLYNGDLTLKDSEGKTPIQYAEHNGNEELIEFLKNYHSRNCASSFSFKSFVSYFSIPFNMRHYLILNN